MRLEICLAKVFLDALVASAVLTPAATASMYFLDAWKHDGEDKYHINNYNLYLEAGAVRGLGVHVCEGGGQHGVAPGVEGLLERGLGSAAGGAGGGAAQTWCYIIIITSDIFLINVLMFSPPLQ